MAGPAARAALTVLALAATGCGGGAGGGAVHVGDAWSDPSNTPTAGPQPAAPDLSLTVGVADDPVDFSRTTLASARAPSAPFSTWPDSYRYSATATHWVRGSAYRIDQASAAPKLPAPCVGTDPAAPCARKLDSGDYELDIRHGGTIRLRDVPNMTSHGSTVAEVALRTARTLHPPATYLIRSLPVSGDVDLHGLYTEHRHVFNTLFADSPFTPADAGALVEALYDLYRNDDSDRSGGFLQIHTRDFGFHSDDYADFAGAGLRIFNHSHWDLGLDPDIVSPAEYQRTIADYRRSVGLGAVHVWSAGNDGRPEVAVHARAPLEHRELEPGWLAVAALDANGVIARYSNRCGAARDWCLAAPGRQAGITGRGTSLAAPVVSGTIAALKAKFPSLDHQQIRARLLETADDSGIYADGAIYGQGRLDFRAAARPVGGLMLPTGGTASGPALSLSGASLQLSRGLAGRYFDGRSVLVLDVYQRAPFRVDLGSLIRRRSGPGLDDLDRAAPLAVIEDPGLPGRRVAVGEGRVARATRESGVTQGLGFGTRGLDGLGAALAGPDLPTVGSYLLSPRALAAGFALGDGLSASRLVVRMAFEPPEARRTPGAGVAGQAPGAVLSASLLSPPGANSLSLSVASDLAAPGGFAGVAALTVSGTAFDVAYARRIATNGPWTLTGHGRINMVEFDGGPLVAGDRALIVTAAIEGRRDLDERLSLVARLDAEREIGGGATRVHLASAVDADGALTLASVSVPHREAHDRQQAVLLLRSGGPGAAGLSWTVGGLVERDAFGNTASILGGRAGLRF